MKAVIYENYGSYDELKIVEVDKPVALDDEVIVKVYAVSLNKADEYMLKGSPFILRLTNGLFKPKLKGLGFDISGIIDSVGKNVSNFKVGDEVFGNTYSAGLAGLSEYTRVKVKHLVKKPNEISYEEACAAPQAAVTALQGIRKANLKSGQSILINGASGGVGLFAVQIAKSYGAKVTAVCSTRSIELVKSYGADEVIDYKVNDFTKNGMKYDVIIGINGYQPIKEYKNSLTKNGVYIMIGGSGAQLFEGMLLAPFYSEKNGRKLRGLGDAKTNQEDLQEVRRLLESKDIKSYIDSTYTLDNTKEAFKYYMEEHALGKVVVVNEW